MFSKFKRFMVFFWGRFHGRAEFALNFESIFKHIDTKKRSCKRCGHEIYVDFIVTDECWDRVTFFTRWNKSSLCLDCFLEVAQDQHYWFKANDFAQISVFINYNWEPLIKQE